jgi:hypothetical protein
MRILAFIGCITIVFFTVVGFLDFNSGPTPYYAQAAASSDCNLNNATNFSGHACAEAVQLCHELPRCHAEQTAYLTFELQTSMNMSEFRGAVVDRVQENLGGDFRKRAMNSLDALQ